MAKKKNLLEYLGVPETENTTPFLLSQEEINKQAPISSELIQKDYSKYQKYLQQNGQPVYDSPETWDEKRALAQSGTEKVFNSLGQMTGTFGTALASTVATLGGAAVGGVGQLVDLATGEDNTDFMNTMVNNPVMKGINDFDKYLKEEIVPTYYTKEQQESLFSAATGTDLLNGVGFLASNIIPNAAVTKLFGSFGKMANAAKAGKLVGVLDKAVDAGTITNAEKMILGGVGKYFETAPAMIGAAVGRLGESSMEAYGTYEQVKDSLTAESQLAQQELELYGQTDKRVLSPEQIEAEAKRGRDNVFMGNMALAASDMLQFTRWFKGDRLADSLIKKGLTTTLKEKTKGEFLGSMLKEAGQEAAEEGFQFLLSKGAEKSARGKSFLEGVDEASGELFSTIEGQKSMLLGAVLGGGMGTAMNVYNHKQQKDTLNALAKELTSVGDVNEKYIVTPEGKRIVNPELSKIATTFMFYEQQKDKALAEGDQETYDIAEKMQFSTLVAAKMDAGNLDEFIDELKDMGKSSAEEVESMFGELPIRNGKKMTPQEVVFEKVQQAEKVKQLNEGLQKIPALAGLSNSGLNQVRHSLLTQEVLRDKITDLDQKIMAVKGRAVYPIPVENQDLFENELLPQDQMELELLEAAKEGTVKNFLESQKQFRDFIKQPELAEEVVEKAQTSAVENAVKEREKDTQTLETFIQANIPDDSLEPNEIKTVVDVNGEEYTILGEDESGNVTIENAAGDVFVLDKERFSKVFANNLVSEETDYEETNDPENNPELDRMYEENPGRIEEDSYKKTTQLASSGQAVAIEGDTRVIEEGEFQLNPEFVYQTELFNEPTLSNNIVSDLKDEPKTIQFKAEKGNIEDLDATNDRRTARGLDPITQEQLESDEFMPIKLTLVVNGRANNKVVSYFHTPDYYYQTAVYDKIEKSVAKGDIKRETADKMHEANLQKQKEIRSELVKQIKDNDSVTLNTVGKSEGVLNFNPKIAGGRKVSPITEVFEGTIDEIIAPKAHNLYIVVDGKKTQIKTKGLEIVTGVEQTKTGFKITVMNSRLTETIFMSQFPYNVGEMVYEIVTPNGNVKRISPFSKQSFTPEQLNSMAELLYHRLTTGEKEINVNGEQQLIAGTQDNPGIIDSLIYVGAVKSTSAEAIGSQLVFAKDGTLVLGTTKITKEDPEAFNKIRNHLNQFKSKPQFKMRSINNEKFGIPVQTEKGWVVEKPMSYTNFMFKGDGALIKTALNKTKFLNTYFIFATDNQDNLLIEGKESKETTAPATTDVVADTERKKLQEELDKLISEKPSLKREDLPDEQLNTKEGTTTQKLADFAAEIYNVPKINIKDGNYISWFQGLSTAGYNLTFKLNGPKLVYDILLEEYNKLKEAEINRINKKLAALETADTRTNEQKIADYRAQEQTKLAKAIPNMAKDYPDTYGDNQGKMPDDLYAIYKPIYDKYNGLIKPLMEESKVVPVPSEVTEKENECNGSNNNPNNINPKSFDMFD